eukprot:3594914-Pleurochrysis_carterae.AAC.1
MSSRTSFARARRQVCATASLVSSTHFEPKCAVYVSRSAFLSRPQVVVVGLLIAIYFLIPSLAVLLTCFLSSRWGDPIAHKGEKRLNHGPEYTLKDEAHSSKVTTVAADAPDADPNGGAHAAASAAHAGGIELERGQAAIHRSRIDTSLDDKRPAVSADAEAAAAVRGVEKGGSVHGGQAGRVYLSFRRTQTRTHARTAHAHTAIQGTHVPPTS